MADLLQIPAVTALPLDQLEQITTCSICHETFKDPRSLPCTHTFCLACTSVCYTTNVRGDFLDCPLCGKRSSRPAGEVGQLPKNIYLNQLMEITTTSLLKSPDVTERWQAVSPRNPECVLETRKLPFFTSTTAKPFAGKLFTYIRLNDLDSTITLLGNLNVTDGEAVLHELSNRGSSPLFEAVRLGRLQFVEFFLDECKVDIEQRCPWWEENRAYKYAYIATPLWLAAISNRLDIVRCLVSRGAKVNAQSNTQSTVVRSACNFDGNESRSDLIRYLVENGADINIPNAAGSYCLHNASLSAELSRYLIEKGANVNAVCCYGRTALHLAVIDGYLDVVKELISHGADPKIRDEDGLDVLHLAVLNDEHEISAYFESQSMSDSRRSDILALKARSCFKEKQYREAITYWRHAILQSTRVDAFKQKLLLYTRSGQTFDDTLLSRRLSQLPTTTDDESYFIHQQILFCEEFLGPFHSETIKSVMYFAAVCADETADKWSVDAIISSMQRCRSRSMERPRYFANALLQFCEYAVDFHSKRASIRFSDVVCAFNLTVDEFVETLEQPFYQIGWPFVLELMKLSTVLIFLLLENASENQEKTRLLELVRSLVQLEPRAYDGRGLLHVALDPSVDSISVQFYPDSPNVLVIETLLKCGAAVNCIDLEGNTPLDYVLESTSLTSDQEKRIVDLLRQYGSVTKSNLNVSQELSGI